MAPSTPYGTLFIVAVLFATSGAAGLTYEVVWQKQLSQILGSNVTASVVVLSGFMAGLAAGSQFLGARLAARPRPIRTYGVVEIVIACLALATPRAFAVLAEVRYEFLAAVGCPDALGHALLTLGVLITVLVPTILMGATLPLLSDVVHDRLGVRGGTMALLYGSNTMGGVVGALGAGVFGVPALGLTRTLTWMVGLNLAVGLVAWMLDAVLVTGGGTAPARVPPSGTPAIGADGNGPSSGAPDRIIQAVFLIGFVAMGYETVLLRLLPFVFGSSTLAFSLMLATGWWTSSSPP